MSKAIRSYAFLCICVLTYLPSAACTNIKPGEGASAPQSPTGETLTPNITEIQSTITSNQTTPWRVNLLRLAGRKVLDSVFFADRTHGWLAAEGALYKTTDGGETWQKALIDIPQDAVVADIFFVKPSLGWVAVQRRASDTLTYQDNKVWVMQTSDGGRSWRLQYEEENVVVGHLAFVDDQRGWLTGIKYVGIGPVRFDFFILHTFDQGQHWMDVSGELNRATANDEGMVNDGIAGIVPEGQLIATVLTDGGKIFKSFDSGKNWKQVWILPGELPQTRICCFGLSENGHLWLAGGANSIEGIGSMVAIEQENNSWVRYRLGGTYFADVLLLPGAQLLACGSIATDEYDLGRRHGVIMFSSDAGRNWSIIYRNKQIKNINAFAAVYSKSIWAVGEDGLVIHLEHFAEKLTSPTSK